jgi:hypothetical protein
MSNILELFSNAELVEKSDGNFKTPCPSCGEDSTGYGGLVLFPETNTSYCHTSGKWFDFEETFALLKGIISCSEGRDANA